MAYKHAAVPIQMNPELTSAQIEEVNFFLKWGYLIVDDALSINQVETLREAMNHVFSRNGQMFTHQLLEEDDRFSFLIDNPPILTRMKAILGNCIQLHSTTGRVTTPGEKDQSWHRDLPWPMDHYGTPYGSIPGQINCGYYLDELTEENGPIFIVPGSHRVPFRPPHGHPTFPDEKQVLAKPGQAVIFDGSLYHRGAANHSTQNRRVCLICYQNAWMKSRETFDGPRITKLREEGSSEVKMLLGEVKSW